MLTSRLATLAFLGAAALATACGTSDATLTGTLALDTFTSAPTGIVAVSDAGDETVAAPDDAGAFTLVVADETTYRLYVEAGGARIPMALRNTTSGFGATLRIGMGGPTVDLGTLRFSAAAAAEALTVTTVDLPVAEDTCVDGVSSATGAACIGADATVVCEDGSTGSTTGHRGGRHGGRHGGPDGAVTDVELTDAPAVVVPTLAAPLNVGCGC